MTRPVAEILEQAAREQWPTSYIDAMANHHLCGNLARDYVNDCFAEEPVADPNCDTCGGSGKVTKREMTESGWVRTGKVDCPSCS